MGTMINRRREMGGKNLPYDAEIEYLESTGTQWIDTGITTKNQMAGIDIELRAPTYQSDTWFCGFNQYTGDDRGGFQIGYYNNSNAVGLYNSTSSSPYRKKVQLISPYSTSWNRYIINALSKGIEINGNMEVTEQVEDFGSDGGVILLFRRGGNLSSSTITSQIKYAKIYINNNNLVRDYIPVRVGNIGYMYDKVSGQLFGNAGTGDFILGPDK